MVTLPPFRTLGGTRPEPSTYIFHGLHDNRNGNIVRYGSNLLAVNDMAGGVMVDRSLNTLGKIPTSLLAIMGSTHPLRKNNYLYNYEINGSGYYELYRISEPTMVRESLVILPTTSFSYLHSFSMTDNYIILMVYPVRWTITSILFSPSILPEFTWNKDQLTIIYLFHLHTRTLLQQTTDAVFSFHHINAYEEPDQDTIILDLIAYHNLSCFYDLTLDALRNYKGFTHGKLRRYRISLTSNHTTYTDPPFPPFEMPQIHPSYQSKPYRYWYGMGVQTETGYPLIQGDMTTRTIRSWLEPDQYPSEPLFISLSPNESDGVIASVVYDARARHSYLLLLNATTMTRIARADMDIPFPFTCHGFFEHKSSFV